MIPAVETVDPNVEQPARAEEAAAPTGSDQARRYLDLDPLRGLVCFGILFMHLYNGTVNSRLEQLFGENATFAVSHLRLGFESFFVLAGFFLARTFREVQGRSISTKSLVLRRGVRLLIPYWAALFLAVLDYWLPNLLLGRSNPVPSPPALAAQAACIQDLVGVPSICAVFWSMAVVIQAFFLWAAAFWIIRLICLKWGVRNREVWVENYCSILLAACWVASLVLAWQGISLEWRLPSAMKFIALGAGCAWVVEGRLKSQWLVMAWLVMLALAFTLPVERAARVIASLVTAVLLLVLASGTRLPRIMPIPLLAWIGKRSYSMYLTHAIVGFRVLNLSNHIQDPSPYVALGLFVAAVVCAIAFGNLFYWLVEVPTTRWSRDIAYRN